MVRVSYPALAVCFCLIGTISGAFAQNATESTPALQSANQRASYGIGLQLGQNFAGGGLDGDLLDLEALVAGIRDALGKKEPRITPDDFQAAMQEVQQLAQGKIKERMLALGELNRREGPAFLKKFGALAGVKALPGGVLYRVKKSGAGPSPQKTDLVRTHYRGRLVNGEQFDSSYDRGEPAVFPVAGVIEGWTDALLKMKVGDHWELAIPANKAYDKDGNPPAIGPDAVLVFELELLGIEPGEADLVEPSRAQDGGRR